MALMPNPPLFVNLVRSLFVDVFQGRHYNQLDNLLTPDFSFQYPFPGFSAGAKGIQQFSEVFHTGIPRFELELHDLFGTERQAAIRWTLRGRHDGRLLGIGATARYVSLSAIGIYGPGHGSGGPPTRIATGSLEMNTIGLLQQMNKLPPTESLFPSLRQN
jgi:hypothetical protein